MGHPDGAHTHGDSSSGVGGAIMLLAFVVLAASVAGAVVSALASILAALAAAVTILGVTALSLIGIAVWRLRSGRASARPPWQSIQQPPSRAEVAKAQRPAIEQSRELHLHLHGISAEEVAAALRQEDISGY